MVANQSSHEKRMNEIITDNPPDPFEHVWFTKSKPHDDIEVSNEQSNEMTSINCYSTQDMPQRIPDISEGEIDNGGAPPVNDDNPPRDHKDDTYIYDCDWFPIHTGGEDDTIAHHVESQVTQVYSNPERSTLLPFVIGLLALFSFRFKKTTAAEANDEPVNGEVLHLEKKEIARQIPPHEEHPCIVGLNIDVNDNNIKYLPNESISDHPKLSPQYNCTDSDEYWYMYATENYEISDPNPVKTAIVMPCMSSLLEVERGYITEDYGTSELNPMKTAIVMSYMYKPAMLLEVKRNMDKNFIVEKYSSNTGDIFDSMD